MSHDIFISYSNEDKLIAEAICHRLEEKGIKCWIYPRDITKGAPYARSLVEAIESSKAMVLIYSFNSSSSNHVMRELEQASKHGIAVIPFRIDDTSPPPEIDYHVSRLHWIDALKRPLDGHINNLTDYILSNWDIEKESKNYQKNSKGVLIKFKYGNNQKSYNLKINKKSIVIFVIFILMIGIVCCYFAINDEKNKDEGKSDVIQYGTLNSGITTIHRGEKYDTVTVELPPIIIGPESTYEISEESNN